MKDEIVKETVMGTKARGCVICERLISSQRGVSLHQPRTRMHKATRMTPKAKVRIRN